MLTTGNLKNILWLLFCDLSKAFDVINHSILLQKLNHYGIRGVANKWFENYLLNRKQYVQIDQSQSNLCKIDCGVPQGSILGPLLYLIYVNDIDKSTDSKILSFADDTSLYASNMDVKKLFSDVNTSVNLLFEWFCANQLSLNASKTKYIVIRAPTSHSDMSNLSIKINNTVLERIGSGQTENSTKFLGIIIDEHLTWKYHLNHINNKISRALFAIKQMKHILPQESLRTLYFALIQPHLNYGVLAWGKANQAAINKTEMLQKKAIRLINKSPYNSHTEPLFKTSEILKLKDLHEYQSLIFMKDYFSNRLPQSFDNSFPYNREVQSTRVTRQANLLHVEYGMSSFSNNSPLYILPLIWNKWANLVSENISRAGFKKNIRSIILSSYSDSIKCDNLFCKACSRI